MKLTVPTQQFSDGLRKVLSVVSTRTTLPVLSNVLLTARDGKLSLTTSDLEVSITTSMEANVETEGSTTLPAKRLGQLASKIKGDSVTLNTDASRTTRISSGSANFKVMGMDAAEFPAEAEMEAERTLILPQVELGKALRKIAYSVSTDQTRFILNGILLSIREGHFTAVATDGRRLALVERVLDEETAFEGDVILPSKAVGELQKLLGNDNQVTIRLTDARASFEIGLTRITTKLVEGAYPNFRQVIPASFENSLVLPREEFADRLELIKVATGDNSSSIIFDLHSGRLTLGASSSDFGDGHDEMEVAYTGDPVKISFNPNFFLEPLRNLDCDDFTIRFNDEFKPVVLLGDEGFLYVIMPMRN